MIRPLCLALTAAISLGCSVSAGSHRGYYDAPVGTLVVDWTVAGTKDGLACRDFGVDRVSIVLSDYYGAFVDELAPTCESFEVAVDLLPSRYTVDAVLLDFDGFEITTVVRDGVRIYDWETSISAFDFPVDSFR